VGGLFTYTSGVPGGTGTTESHQGIVLRNNDIYGGQRSINLGHVEEILIENNRLSLKQTRGGFNTHVLIHTIPPTDGWITGAELTIRGNRVAAARTASNNAAIGVWGFLLDSPGDNTYTIENNFIGGIDLTATAGSLTRFAGINLTRATSSTLVVQHNSIDMEAPAGLTGLDSSKAFTVGVTNTGFTGTVIVKNNIIRAGGPGVAALNFAPATGVWFSDNNIFFSANGAIGRRNGAVKNSLVDWQGTGLDANSRSIDARLPDAPFHGRWLLGDAGGDLHFSATPGIRYQFPAIPGITSDIDGETRGSTTFAGADEPEDADADGTPNSIEDIAENAGDGNNDGTLDRLQAHVASFVAIDGTVLTLATTDTLALVNVTTIDPPGSIGYHFPYGLLQFDIAGVPLGGAATVAVHLPDGHETTSWFKYGPEAGNVADHWYEFLNDGTTGATLGNPAILQFVDGQRGDRDLTANGVISDPSGPSAPGTASVHDWTGH
jgi:hypothetical protein